MNVNLIRPEDIKFWSDRAAIAMKGISGFKTRNPSYDMHSDMKTVLKVCEGLALMDRYSIEPSITLSIEEINLIAYWANYHEEIGQRLG